MTPAGTRTLEAVVVGTLAGIVAGLVFATLHAFIIVPIWDRMLGGLAFGAVAGAVGGWAYLELYPAHHDVTPATIAGARYGTLLWLAIAPVSVVDAILRAVGFLPRYELVGVVIALAVAATTGALWGWHRTRRKRGMIAGVSATLFLLFATGGPVPIGRSIWAFGIFLAILPASIVAGAILGSSIAFARGRLSPHELSRGRTV